MKPIRLMIVDDILDVREQLATAIKLSAESVDVALEIVATAGDGREAIQQADQVAPDVILMDLEMPELGGLSAATRIKASHPKTCIIALTIHDSPSTRLAVIQAGMDGLICKGAAIHQIVKEVNTQSIKYDSSGTSIQNNSTNDKTKGR
jgi:two-component system nitrate/nitrite response regulator NarL